MPTITAKSLREKTSQELQDQLLLERKRLFDGIVKSASGEAIKPHEKRGGKRLIARIQSILRERALRGELDKKIAELAPQSKDAGPAYTRLARHVEKRTTEIKSELAKKEDRKVKPMPGRVRVRGVALPADRAAIRLAEARRCRAALEHEDVGQGR